MADRPAPLSQAEADAFAALTSGVDQLTCLCVRPQHQQITSDGVLPYCGKPAVVRVECHAPHVCRDPQLRSRGQVDQWGNAHQVLCLQCLDEMRNYAAGVIAQTRARCTELSTSCPTCHGGLAVRDNGQVLILEHCPACGTKRQHVDPVCGGGIRQAHGCGAKLDTVDDVVRTVTFLDATGDNPK